MSNPSATDSTSPKTVNSGNCPAGKTVIGGGATILGGDGNVTLSKSEPGNISGSPQRATRWDAVAFEANDEPGDWSVVARVICADG